jgi:hypothetical protein
VAHAARLDELVESGQVRFVSVRIVELRRLSSGVLVVGEDGETVSPALVTPFSV